MLLFQRSFQGSKLKGKKKKKQPGSLNIEFLKTKA